MTQSKPNAAAPGRPSSRTGRRRVPLLVGVFYLFWTSVIAAVFCCVFLPGLGAYLTIDFPTAARIEHVAGYAFRAHFDRRLPRGDLSIYEDTHALRFAPGPHGAVLDTHPENDDYIVAIERLGTGFCHV